MKAYHNIKLDSFCPLTSFIYILILSFLVVLYVFCNSFLSTKRFYQMHILQEIKPNWFDIRAVIVGRLAYAYFQSEQVGMGNCTFPTVLKNWKALIVLQNKWVVWVGNNDKNKVFCIILLLGIW